MNILEKQMHIYAYVACIGHWTAYGNLLSMCQPIDWSLCHHQRQVDPPRWSHKRPSISQGRPRAEDSHPLSKVHSIPHLRSSIPHRRPREEYSHGDIQQSQYPTWDQVSHSAAHPSIPEKKIRTQYPMIIESHKWYPVSEAHTGDPPSQGGSSSHQKVTVAITVNITISDMICHRWGDQGKSQGTHGAVPPTQQLVKPAGTLPRAQKADLLPTAKWRLLSLSSPYVDQGETETKTNRRPGDPREAVPPSQPSSSTTVSHHPKFTVSQSDPSTPESLGTQGRRSHPLNQGAPTQELISSPQDDREYLSRDHQHQVPVFASPRCHYICMRHQFDW